MKSLNTLGKVAIAALTLVLLNACSQTSNGSGGTTAAVTPASTTICPATGYYVNSAGQNVPCTPGQIIPTTGSFPVPTGGYPYQSNPTTGCTTYLAEYGQPYVPMLLSGQLVCVNYYDLLQYLQQSQYASTYQATPYYTYGPDYYYAYPPYQYSSGTGCGTSISLSYGEFSGSVCF